MVTEQGGGKLEVWTAGKKVTKWTPTYDWGITNPIHRINPWQRRGKSVELCVMATLQHENGQANATLYTRDCRDKYSFICELHG
jgi:hypothetical protein